MISHNRVFSIRGDYDGSVIGTIVTEYASARKNVSIEDSKIVAGSSLDYIIEQCNIPNTCVKVTKITEVSYNYDEKEVILKPIYEYNFDTKDWDLENRIGADKLTKLLKLGLVSDDIDVLEGLGLIK